MASSAKPLVAARCGCWRLRFRLRVTAATKSVFRKSQDREHEGAVLQLLTGGPEFEERRVDFVLVFDPCAEHQVLLHAFFDEPSEPARGRVIFVRELAELRQCRSHRTCQEAAPFVQHVRELGLGSKQEL